MHDNALIIPATDIHFSLDINALGVYYHPLIEKNQASLTLINTTRNCYLKDR